MPISNYSTHDCDNVCKLNVTLSLCYIQYCTHSIIYRILYSIGKRRFVRLMWILVSPARVEAYIEVC